MIPKLRHLSPVQIRYLAFLEALQVTAFKGDICPDYANRTVLATDNSIYQILPQGVVYPRDTNDLITLCRLAGKAEYRDIVLSARGGGTGTNGQSLTDGLVVDLSRHMNNILEINAEEDWARVQTGVVKDQLNAALKPHGLFFAPELSTSNRATIGGMINTDASGQGSCLYGKTRDHVIELTTVLADGSVLSSRPLEDDELDAAVEQQDRIGLVHRIAENIDKENWEAIQAHFPKLNRCLTGYDLAHIRDEDGRFNLNNILCGSEGTLGFISEAKINVLPIPKFSALVVVKYADFNQSLRDATNLMNAAPSSIETIDSKVLKLAMNDFIWHQVEEFFSEETAQPVQGINLVEYTADDEAQLKASVDGLLQMLDDDLPENDDADVARLGYTVAWGHESVNKVWAMRKRAVGLLGNVQDEARPIPFVEDTAVPPEHLADFILEFREILDAYQLEYGMFGHVDAGVLHVRPALDMKDPEQEKIAWEISDRIADLCYQYHGLLWGEHGKGVRSEYSPQFFGELYPLLQRIKAAFDPHNQLNPGKIATSSDAFELLKIDEVPTRGQADRNIVKQSWLEYGDAVYCNGNGACFNWNSNDAMCPSYKVTRDRVHSPKGRASLVREWLKLLSENNAQPASEYAKSGLFNKLTNLPRQVRNTREKRRGEYDFSNEVYNSMAGCLACKSCAGQCPIKVNVPEFRSQFLALYHTRYLRSLKDHLVGSLEYLLPYCAFAPRAYNLLMSLSPVKYLLQHVVGFVDGPKLTGISLKKAGVVITTSKVISNLSEEEKARAVVIVQDAFTTYFETQLVINTVNLLNTLGYNAMLAPYRANGKPMHVHGFLHAFTKAAKRNAAVLRSIAAEDIPLVGIDPSMTLTYRSEYNKYIGEGQTPQVHLLQEWLFRNLDELQVPAGAPKTFKLMPHCTESTNAGNSDKQWQAVFNKFGHTLEVMNVGCCGMAGTYGHESRNRENSRNIYQMSWRQPVEQYFESGQLVATGYSCRSQIKREDNKQVPHPVQALLSSLQLTD
jgi:FAD/FMN-containing dehydrogenase/Fe-S oxidoreductase